MSEARGEGLLAGKYRLEEELGRGGMGAVYRAFHVGVHRAFAVKVLNVELAEKKAIAERFLREAQAAGRIGHRAILEVFDVGEDAKGRPFMVMELLEGESLGELLERGPLAPEVAAWVAVELLDALAAAHAAGVIHRDVKPQNVFLVGRTRGPRTVKLLDFGIAKFLEGDGASVTRSGEIIGSPLYMAPEQARGESSVDARADVWSVGACLFQMLTGRAAHEGSSAVAVLARILTEKAPPPSSRRAGLPPELDAIVLKSLAIDREARWPSARAMKEALEAWRAETGAGEPTFAEIGARAPMVVRRDADAGGEDVTDAAVSTKTSESAARNVGGGTSAAVTASLGGAREPGPPPPPDGKGARSPVLAVAALALLVGAATVPWLVPEWRTGHATAHAQADAYADANANANANAGASASANANASANADADATAGAQAEARADAAVVPVRTVAPRVPVGPACGAGEVVSEGHCCPRGLVWQAGRCERPVATSF